jgi:acyl carrier protein
MTVTEADIRSAIQKTVVGIDAAALDASADFYNSGIDSLDHASILLELQEKNGLVVPDDDLAECRSIQGILTYAAAH